MKVICGLGNPGKSYQNTRHNVGFRVVEALASALDFPAFKEEGKALLSVKGQGGERIFLMKPLTFMNSSGEAVLELLRFYKIAPSDLIVVYDDVDLPLGTLRYREKGSAGTHNGMKSIIQCLATLDFPRLRLGIESRGEFAPQELSLHDFVLAPFLPDEAPVLQGAIEEAVQKLTKELA